MYGDNMEITQIEYFLEVADSQHITQSAEKLHIAQPALSQAIKRLESELGVPLFEKKGRNIVLTEYGKYLQNQLLPVKERLDDIPSALQKMAKQNADTIHINVLAASTIITDAIIEYQSQHSGISFQLIQNEQAEITDIEITTKMFFKVSDENKSHQYTIPEKIYLAVPNNAKYNKKSIALSEVADEQFISLMGSKQFRYICDRFCHKAEVSPHIVFESDSPAAVKNMIAANLGVGFWPEFTWGKVDNDNIKLLEISDPMCSRDIVFTCNPSKLANENIRHFFTFLKEYCESRK